MGLLKKFVDLFFLWQNLSKISVPTFLLPLKKGGALGKNQGKAIR